MKISQYGLDSTPSLSSKLIGTDTSDSNITKNYEFAAIAQLINENTQFASVLVANSTVSQVPSGVGVATQVSFGSAQSNDAVSLAANGLVTFNQTGLYMINAYGSIERQGSSGGVSIILFRFLVNGVQASAVKGFHLDSTDVVVPYEITFPLNITTIGTTISFEIMRDASGTGSGLNQGGLYPHTNLSGWSNIPSADLNIWQLQ
jgi:hypothetical protein